MTVAFNKTPMPRRCSTPCIVLKLDDMFVQDGRVPERWERLARFAEERNTPFSSGLICNSLEGDHPAYFAELKRLAATGRVEFWHHGYDHAQWPEGDRTLREFSNTSRAHQQDHFDRATKLAKEKLDLTFTTFGAPFNATDATTAEVLAGAPEIRVWLYGDTALPAGKFIARRPGPANIEAPVHKPNYDAFVTGYESGRLAEQPYLVLQGHPVSWDEAAFAEFVRIIDFLAAQGCAFVLPRELPGLGE
jgi:peptidoglycan/xylan/chitin deacetylase (PgdA/CDA1 family)